MDSQYGTSQLVGLVQLLFTSDAGAFVIKSAYGAVSVARQGTGVYQFQLNTGVNNGNIAVEAFQYGSTLPLVGPEDPPYAMNITWANPTTPIASGLTEPANIVEIDFTIIVGGSAGDPVDPAQGVMINVAFQSCYDGETGQTF